MSSKNYHILIVDDDLEFHKDTRFALQKHYVFDGAQNLDQLRQKLDRDENYDLLLLDLVLDPSNEKIGLKLLPEIIAKMPNVPIIVATSDGEIETVVEAMKLGASDYLHKENIDYDLWHEKFRITIEGRELKVENLRLKEEIQRFREKESEEYPFIGETAEILKIKRTLKIVSEEPNVTILLTGETGVGKEVAARYLHRHGARKDKPFQAVNLSAVQKTLLESELFGHIKGAFTGATKDKSGYFRQADGGILVLDEIGDIDFNIQIKLLRFLETKLIRPVGSDKDIKLDVQILAATHRNLKEEVEKGTFREDLYQRLKAKIIKIPPLRMRRADIPLITSHYLAKHGHSPEIFDAETTLLLENYSWKGNVRELCNSINSMLLEKRILDKEKIDVECLPLEIKNYHPSESPDLQSKATVNGSSSNDNSDYSIDEKKAILDLKNVESALFKRNKVKKDVAVDLGFETSDNLRYRIKTYYDKYPYLFNHFPLIQQCYDRVLI